MQTYRQIVSLFRGRTEPTEDHGSNGIQITGTEAQCQKKKKRHGLQSLKENFADSVYI